ncbi:MAG: SDR family oxidoreductase [Halieaceae bacterium]|nr:SDR family oxidoreductase [Halieaceae bacterium]
MSKTLGSRSTTDEVLAGIDLSAKTALVTGSNCGIGFETAQALAGAGARVIFACRNSSSGRDAVERARQRHPDSDVEFGQIDLASVASIKQFCDALADDTIDILVCNAGLVSTDYKETLEGLELTVGVCHFGHFLLTRLLMPRLLAAKTPRVVMVSSVSHKSPATLSFERFPLTADNFGTMLAYGQAKLCNVLLANELQRRYGDQGLTACSLHPGALVTTDIGRGSLWMSVFMKLVSPFTKNVNQGASTTVFCAVHEESEEVAGKYFSHCALQPSSREANDPDVAARLWELSDKWSEKVLGQGL